MLSAPWWSNTWDMVSFSKMSVGEDSNFKVVFHVPLSEAPLKYFSDFIFVLKLLTDAL